MNMRLAPMIGLCVLLIVACMRTGDVLKMNQERGAAIIQALARYEEDYGQFPAHLDTLMPNYLFAIPKTVAGYEFTYMRSAVDGYVLCFADGRRCCYLHRNDLWDCSPGD